MDAQTSVGATAALCALVQSVSRLELGEGYASPALLAAGEMLEENRFLAARDGIEAQLLDPDADVSRPARRQLDELLAAARPHADALGCRTELEGVAELGASPGFARQLAIARARGDLPGVLAVLAGDFTAAG
jgi:carboxylate-amine ligase